MAQPVTSGVQLSLFEPDGYRFIRNVDVGDVFVLGNPEHHSGEFEVTAKRGWTVRVRFTNRHGDLTDYDWHVGANDLCIVVRKGNKQGKQAGKATSKGNKARSKGGK